MKTLISLLTLIAVVAAYFFSASLYVQGEMFAAYSLVVASIAGVSVWIKTHDLLKVHRAA
jgi:intracellular septation protein A